MRKLLLIAILFLSACKPSPEELKGMSLAELCLMRANAEIDLERWQAMDMNTITSRQPEIAGVRKEILRIDLELERREKSKYDCPEVLR